MRPGRHDLGRVRGAPGCRGAEAAHPLRIVPALEGGPAEMRRAILAVVSTIAGLVALLSFKSHVPAIAAATSGTGVSSGGTSGSGSGSSGTGSSGSGSSGSSSGGQGFATGQQTGLPAGEHTVTGNVAHTMYGPV